MKKIALINQKGGVGKTTSCINLGAALKQLGKKVLLVDLDPQAHLTYGMGIEAHNISPTVYDLLKGTAKIDQVMIIKEGLKVIPSSLALSGAEVEFSGIAGREFLLKESIEGIKDIDYVLIDCPPSLGLLTLNALTTADEVYIPVQTEFLPLQGVSQLDETVKTVKKRLNRNLEISGIIATRCDKRKTLTNEVIDKIKQYFGDKLFNTFIRDNVSVAEAPSFGQTIFSYKSTSHGAVDYLNLAKEILIREMSCQAISA